MIVIYEWVLGFESPVDYAACLTIVAVFSLFSWKLVEPRNRTINQFRYGPASALAIMIAAYGIADRPHAFRGLGVLGPVLGPAYEYSIWSVDPYSLHNEWWRRFESNRRETGLATQSDVSPEIVRLWNEDLGTYISTVHFSRGGSEKTIIVLGDSYVDSAMAMIVDYAARTGTSVIAHHIANCQSSETKCAAAFRNIQNLAVSKSEDIAFVFYASRFKEPSKPFNRYLSTLAAALNQSGIPLVMQGPTPTFPGYNPRMCLSLLKQDGKFCLGHVPAVNLLTRFQMVDTWQSGFTNKFSNVHIWRPWDMFCNENECRYRDQQLSYFRDEDHLSVRGSLFLTDHFSDYIAASVPAERLAQ